MQFETPKGPLEAKLSHVTVAGWTGRDRAAVDHHIEELAAIGVTTPSQVPLYYRVSESLLTQSPTIQVMGAETSGEIEPLVIRTGGELYLGLASDHTDRALEVSSVAASKQICAKPVARTIWAWDDVKDHLDALELTTEIEEAGAWTMYQKGTLAAIRLLPELISGSALPDEAAMLCGTLPAIGGVRPASAYRMALTDPLRGQTIALTYSVATLPVVS